MPVNMDPKKRLKKATSVAQPKSLARSVQSRKTNPGKFGEETETDREKALADAEWKNLWDATEVIDMDKW
jgi:hypothetical protein